VVSVSVVCIYNLLSVFAPLAEAGNCAHRPIRSTRHAQTISSESVRGGHSECVTILFARNFLTRSFLFSHRHACFIFTVKKIFLS
jgi:hypothetical protein